MIYVLYGTEDFLIKKEIKQILNENDGDVSQFNLEDCNLKHIIEDASTFSLFSNKRIIIVENSYIFTGSNKKNQDTKCLEAYIKDPNPSNILIFVVNHEKLDNRKKIVSLIKEKGNIIELNEVSNLNQFVLDLCKPYQISNQNIRLLIDRVGTNLYLLDQEINKLKIYKDDDYQINDKDILNITVKTIDTDIFHLIENIVLNDKKKALESYYEMLKLGEEPIKIIVMLANQFRLIYQVKNLSKQKISIYDMMNILGQKKYPIEKALEKSRTISNETLINHIKNLSDLDINIKSGKIDKNIGLELFILEN